MKLTKYKPFDPAWHFANKIGQMFYKSRDTFTYAFEFQDRKAAKQYGLSKYTMVRIDDNHTRDKDKFHYEITLFNRKYEPVPMMKFRMRCGLDCTTTSLNSILDGETPSTGRTLDTLPEVF